MMMLRSTVAQVLRRWRSQYRSANHIDVVYPTSVIEKISDSTAGFCLRATLFGAAGYVLGGLATKSISEDELRTEQSAIQLHRFVDLSERHLVKREKSRLQREEINPSKKNSLSDDASS